MTWHRTALAALALTAAAGLFAADAPKAEPGHGHHDRLDAMAAKLGLNEQQKGQIHQIHEEYIHKIADAEHQLWTLHHEEHEAMGKVLTDEQRAKVPELLKAAREKELEKVAGELGVTDEQKKKLQPILEEQEKKFHDLASKGVGEGEGGREQFRHQRHEFVEAVAKELTDEQRAKLPGIMREEYHQWRDPSARREHLKALADQLGLNDDQRGQIKKIHEEYDQKTKQPASELKQLHQEEHAAVEKVLTDEQRTKLQELRKGHEAGDKKPAEKGNQ